MNVTQALVGLFSGIPKITPSLVGQYGSPIDDPNEVEMFAQNPNAPTVDQIFDRHIYAIGGGQRLEALGSFYAKGTYSGFDTSDLKVPVEIFAKGPNQRTVTVHGPLGDGMTTFDGRIGWISGPDKPVPVLALSAGADLDGMKLDASPAFPLRARKVLGKWRTGFPVTAIDERRVDVAEGIAPSGLRVKLFFDQETGLLLRSTQFTNTAVGIVPAQVDYSDYREVAGVKMPFMDHYLDRWAIDNEIQANVAVDAAKFARPSAPSAQRSRTAEK